MSNIIRIYDPPEVIQTTITPGDVGGSAVIAKSTVSTEVDSLSGWTHTLTHYSLRASCLSYRHVFSHVNVHAFQCYHALVDGSWQWVSETTEDTISVRCPATTDDISDRFVFRVSRPTDGQPISTYIPILDGYYLVDELRYEIPGYDVYSSAEAVFVEDQAAHTITISPSVFPPYLEQAYGCRVYGTSAYPFQQSARPGSVSHFRVFQECDSPATFARWEIYAPGQTTPERVVNRTLNIDLTHGYNDETYAIYALFHIGDNRIIYDPLTGRIMHATDIYTNGKILCDA